MSTEQRVGGYADDGLADDHGVSRQSHARRRSSHHEGILFPWEWAMTDNAKLMRSAEELEELLKSIIWAADLPKARSGKIMRRLLRDIADGREPGDVTTLGD